MNVEQSITIYLTNPNEGLYIVN